MSVTDLKHGNLSIAGGGLLRAAIGRVLSFSQHLQR